jgi:hypothetical protein
VAGRIAVMMSVPGRFIRAHPVEHPRRAASSSASRSASSSRSALHSELMSSDDRPWNPRERCSLASSSITSAWPRSGPTDAMARIVTRVGPGGRRGGCVRCNSTFKSSVASIVFSMTILAVPPTIPRSRNGGCQECLPFTRLARRFCGTRVEFCLANVLQKPRSAKSHKRKTDDVDTARFQRFTIRRRFVAV